MLFNYYYALYFSQNSLKKISILKKILAPAALFYFSMFNEFCKHLLFKFFFFFIISIKRSWVDFLRYPYDKYVNYEFYTDIFFDNLNFSEFLKKATVKNIGYTFDNLFSENFYFDEKKKQLNFVEIISYFFDFSLLKNFFYSFIDYSNYLFFYTPSMLSQFSDDFFFYGETYIGTIFEEDVISSLRKKTFWHHVYVFLFTHKIYTNFLWKSWKTIWLKSNLNPRFTYKNFILRSKFKKYIHTFVKPSSQRAVLINSRTLFSNKFKIYINVFYGFFKNSIVPLIVAFSFFFFSFFFFKLSFLKTLANWGVFSLFVFWLLSTFNFFIKRYRYGKYTSALQRFWKRAFMCFWMIEGFLFTIFFYLLLNASGEPQFMFDQPGFYITHLISMKNFLFNAFLVVILINFFIFILINLKFSSFRQNVFYLILITLFLVYLLFVESYQFYYLVNYYDEFFWNYFDDEGVWECEHEIPRTRNRNHFVTLILLAKFWHYIFIFASWVFFVMKIMELNRVRYSFLSMNLQNIIIFYIMNWLCVFSWLKWFLRRFMDQPYYWFFLNFRPITLTIILHDFVSFIFSFFDNFLNFFFYKNKFYKDFYYLSFIPAQLYERGVHLQYFFSSNLY